MSSAAANATPRVIPSHPGIFRIGESIRSAGEVLPSGFAELDRELPGGGWPRAGLTEIACDQTGIGELSLLLKGSRKGHLLWILPDSLPWIPYAPELHARGMALAQLAIVRTHHNEDTLWAAEQALRSGACETVLLWLTGRYCNPLNLRRLQQAAMMGNSAAYAMRPLDSLASPSPAVLRLALHAEAQGSLRIELVKRRGLPPDKSVRLSPRALPCLAREGMDAIPNATPHWLQRLLAGEAAPADRNRPVAQPR